MSTYKATISSVDLNTTAQKKDGSGSFGTVTLVYNTQFGEKVKSIAHYKLQQNPTLASAVKKLKPGDVVYMTTEGFDLVNIDTNNTSNTPAGVASYNKTKFTPKTQAPFDPYGAQVGNALNVAAQLIANKVTRTDNLKNEAIKVLQIGEELKTMLQNGTVAKNETPAAAPIEAPQFDEELNDEVPF